MFKLVPTKEKERDEEYTFADGTEVIFNVYQGIPVEHVYYAYVDSLATHVEVTDYIEKYTPDKHRKYLDELREHLDSESDDGERDFENREFQAGKERNWGA